MRPLASDWLWQWNFLQKHTECRGSNSQDFTNPRTMKRFVTNTTSGTTKRPKSDQEENNSDGDPAVETVVPIPNQKESGQVDDASSSDRFSDDDEFADDKSDFFPQGDADGEPLDRDQYLSAGQPLKRVDRHRLDWHAVKYMPDAEDTGILVYTAAELALTQEFSQVYGMPNIRQLLISRIYRVVQNPERYRIGQPLHDGISLVQRLIYLYGKHGTGVNLLIKAFCKETGVTLIEARGALFKPAEQLNELYQLAQENQPAIVLLTDCEPHFAPNSPHVIPLMQYMDSIADSGAAVWTIFRAEILITALDLRLANIVDYSMWTQVPDEMSRAQLFIKALLPVMKPKLDSNGHVDTKKLPISKRELRKLTDKSVDCIPRNIFGFVRHCYNQKIDRLDNESPLHDDADVKLEINDLEFISLPNMPQRITANDPTHDNIRVFNQMAAMPGPQSRHH